MAERREGKKETKTNQPLIRIQLLIATGERDDVNETVNAMRCVESKMQIVKISIINVSNALRPTTGWHHPFDGRIERIASTIVSEAIIIN